MARSGKRKVAERSAVLREGSHRARMATVLGLALAAVSLPGTAPGPATVRAAAVGSGGAVLRGWQRVGAGEERHKCGARQGPLHTCAGTGANLHGFPETAVAARAPEDRFSAVVTGEYGTCGVEADYDLTCWGGVTGPPAGRVLGVAFGNSTCVLRLDRTVRCWEGGPSPAPPGRFKQIVGACGLRESGREVCWSTVRSGGLQLETAPGRFVWTDGGCGVRPSGSVACWQDHALARDEPKGRFLEVSAGGDPGPTYGDEDGTFACALRRTHTLICWGKSSYGETRPPRGRFTSVSSGYGFACATRAAAHALCWGHSGYGELEVPREPLAEVSVADWGGAAPPFACGVEINHDAVCWGDNTYGEREVPGARWVQAATGPYMGPDCGLRSDGSLACWGLDSDQWHTTERFREISLADGPACGLLVDQRLYCVGGLAPQAGALPAGRFSSVGFGGWDVCGVRIPSHWITCSNLPEPGTDKFRSVAVGDTSEFDFACAIRLDRRLFCWGNSPEGETDAPSGSFLQVSAGAYGACAIRTDRAVVCWGALTGGTLPGRYLQVSVGNDWACGVRTDRQIRCLGQDEYSSWWSGPYRSVSVGYGDDDASDDVCGVRSDGELSCGGYLNVNLPAAEPGS